MLVFAYFILLAEIGDKDFNINVCIIIYPFYKTLSDLLRLKSVFVFVLSLSVVGAER